MFFWLIVAALFGYVWRQFFTGRSVEDDLRAQADDVRSICKRLRLNAFPEIFSQPHYCSTCRKQALLLVIPYLCCYKCLSDAVNEAHQDICIRLKLEEPENTGASFEDRWQLPKCVAAGLVAVVLVFGFYFVGSIVAVEMIGFTIGFASPGLWLVFAFVIFAAGFLWKLRRLRLWR